MGYSRYPPVGYTGVMTTRPVSLLGPDPDGVHRYLYQQSTNGNLELNPRDAAANYGLDQRGFMGFVNDLANDGLVTHHPRPVHPGAPPQRHQRYTVTEPEDYDENDPYLGKKGPRQQHSKKRKGGSMTQVEILLEDIEYTLAHRDEWDDDQVETFENLLDKLGDEDLENDE